jgi:hypothetical protein
MLYAAMIFQNCFIGSGFDSKFEIFTAFNSFLFVSIPRSRNKLFFKTRFIGPCIQKSMDIGTVFARWFYEKNEHAKCWWVRFSLSKLRSLARKWIQLWTFDKKSRHRIILNTIIIIMRFITLYRFANVGFFGV